MRLQSGSPGLAVGDADNRYLRLNGGTLAGNLNVGSGRIVATAPAGTIPQSGGPSAGQTLEHTWNGAGNTWTAFQVNVTNTASGADSKLLDLLVSGSSKFSVGKGGQATVRGGDGGSTNGFALNFPASSSTYGFCTDGNQLRFGTHNFAIAYTTGGGTRYDSAFILGWAPSSADGGNDTAISRNGSGVVEFNNGTAGALRDWKARRGSLSEYLDIVEMTAPIAPAANTARLYVEDNGSGKTRLMVLFPSGAAQQLAIEP